MEKIDCVSTVSGDASTMFDLDTDILLIAMECYIRYAPEGVRKEKPFVDTVDRMIKQSDEIKRIQQEHVNDKRKRELEAAQREIESAGAIGGIPSDHGAGQPDRDAEAQTPGITETLYRVAQSTRPPDYVD